MKNKIATSILEQLGCKIKVLALGSVFVVMLTAAPVRAFEAFKNSDWTVTWDNTLKYSAAFRVEDQDPELLADVNADDGNLNFDTGLVSNRLDVFSELDIVHRNFGLRVSGAGWVDSLYLSDNDNDSPGTSNGTGNHDEFPNDTEQLHGLKVELLDAFLFGKVELGNKPLSFRLGRHTSLWGETLFFAANGIAHAQAPIDIIKAVSVPGTQARELFMPLNQVSAQMQVFNNLSLAAYWQFEWRRSRMNASGAYFSDTDVVDAGGERILLGPNLPNGLPGPSFYRGNDLGAGDSTSEFGDSNYDQYGLSVRFRVEQLDTDFGIYYTHFNENLPYWLYVDPSKADPAMLKFGEYFMVFPKDIHMIGASFGTQIGAVNVSGEVSERFDTPLVSSSATQVIIPGTTADNDENPLYAIGDTLHANLSAIYLMGPSLLWQGGSIVAEAGYNYLIDITENEGAFDQTRDDWALGFRMVFEPAYYQVFPGIDLRVPIGLGYNPRGRSPVDLKFNGGGADEGGDVSIGLNVDYLTVWKFGIKYTNYFGEVDDLQTLADRDFVSLSVQRTF